MGEPALKTRYQDNYQAPASSSDENQLTLIGLASDGPMDDFQDFRGMAGLAAAEAMFGTTLRLPRAIREAITVTTQVEKPITVHALRGGEGAAKAVADFPKDDTTGSVFTLEYDGYGTDGNGWSGKYSIVDGDVILTLRDADGETTEVNVGDSPTSDSINAAIAAAGLTFTFAEGADWGAGALADTWVDFEGGLNGTMTNAEVIRLLQIAEDANYPNVLVLGATSAAARQAVSTHCADQLTERQIERFAAVEFASFDSTEAANSTAWRVDIDEYVTAREGDVDGDDDRNLIAFAGSDAVFLDANGDEYEAPVTAAAFARWLGEPINRSMINLQVPTVQRLAHKFPPEYRDRLADARFNYVRFEEGRGFIIANDRTMAGDTSDFKYAQDLRAVYTCGQEYRRGAMPVWGEPNDPLRNDGLEKLKSAGEKPLERRKGKTIADYASTPSIDDDGDTIATLSITTYTAMRDIDHVVYRAR